MNRLLISTALVGFVCGAFSPAPEMLGDVLIEGPSVLAPGSRAALRVAAFQSEKIGDLRPAAGARVLVTLADAEVFSGATDEHGGADVAFRVPDLKEGNVELKVEIQTVAGPITHKQNIRIQNALKILLVTDKPLYQPGQIIHLRALALADLSMAPAADVPLLFEIEDAKGNKVFKQSQTTSKFGVAAVDFQLADEVNMGDFRVTATIGESKAEKSVNVSAYVLPKFKVELTADRSFYAPLETVKGKIQADYFFGKPVADAKVEVVASTFDAAFREFARLTLKTDAKGRADFEFKLPDYFVGTPLNQGNASVKLEAKVVDGAEHAQQVARTIPVSDQPLRIYAVAESGRIVPGVENILTIITADPNGGSIPSIVTVKAAGRTIEKETNDLGYVEVRLTPKSEHLAQREKAVLPVEIAAVTKEGAKASKTLEIPTEPAGDAILLRPDKAIYAAGDAIALEILGSFGSGDIFLDVVKKGQTLLTATVPIEDGRAAYRMAASPDAFGSLEIHAYAINKLGEMIRDARIVYVQPAQDLAVAISTDRQQYRPGDLSKIEFQVTDRSGRGVAAALGVIIVDESVYALQEMQPGLEKVYFMLEKELAAPKIEFCPGGATVTNLVGLREVQQTQQEVGKMLFAGAEPAARRWTRNTVAERRRAMAQQLERLYWPLYQIVSKHGKEITERAGERRVFMKDGLGRCRKYFNQFNLNPKDLVDPWGRQLTLDVLAQLDARFSVEGWRVQFGAGNYGTFVNALAQHAIGKELVRFENGAWRYRPELIAELIEAKRIACEQTVDPFGDPYTLESMARIYEIFKPEQLARLTREQRLATLFQQLCSVGTYQPLFVVKDGKVVGYAPDAPARIRESHPELMLADEYGKPLDLAALAAQEPAFAAANVARIADAQREMVAIYKTQEVLAQQGLEGVATFDLNTASYKFREGLVARWAEEKKIDPEVARTVDGRPITLEGLAAANPAAALGNHIKVVLYNKMHSIYNALYQYGNKHRDLYHNRRTGELTFPEGVVNLLITDKLLAREGLIDPWGGPIRLVRLEKKEQNVVWWNMPFNRVESAGPDRTFGTADDIQAPMVQQFLGFSPNYRGAIWYQSSILHQWWGDLAEEGVHFAKDFGGRGFGGAVRKAGRMRGLAVPEAPAAAAELKQMRRMEANDKMDDREKAADAGGGAAPRVREYFPETLLWLPNLITDERGRATIDLKMADSITSWRLTATASSATGLLGSGKADITVFQDFFVDLDLPVALTQNDRVSIPVAVYNYLKEPQKIELKMEPGDWFDLEGDPIKNVFAEPDQVQVVYYPIRVKKIGDHTLTVTAIGSKLSDAIKRQIEVVPDGRRVEEVLNGSLTQNLAFDLNIPGHALEDASRILVKFYPGAFSQVMDGLDGMLAMPGG
jgi:hypothetical protein